MREILCGRRVLRYSAVAATMMVAAPCLAGEGMITAVIDQARLIKIPAGTQTLVIGNPTVADVTLIKQNNLMILSPKAFGQTNFIALDAGGNAVAESTIEVVAGDGSLIVQRGMERQSYSCAPKCQPTERLGDDDHYLNATASQDKAHTERLAASAAPPSGSALAGPR